LYGADNIAQYTVLPRPPVLPFNIQYWQQQYRVNAKSISLFRRGNRVVEAGREYREELLRRLSAILALLYTQSGVN